MALWRSKKKAPQEDGGTNVPADSNETVGNPKSSSGGLFAKMRAGLSKTREKLNTDIRDLFKAEGRLVDDDFLGDLYARLISTDMGLSLIHI